MLTPNQMSKDIILTKDDMEGMHDENKFIIREIIIAERDISRSDLINVLLLESLAIKTCEYVFNDNYSHTQTWLDRAEYWAEEHYNNLVKISEMKW